MSEYGDKVIGVGGPYTGGPNLISQRDVDKLFDEHRPVLVFHVAGYNGGIKLNLEKPSHIFYENTVMGLNVIEACHNYGVKKVVSVVASCAYPEMAWENHGFGMGCLPSSREVMVEKEFLDGPPHASVACHGYAKRNLFLAGLFSHYQYGLNAVCVCPTTLFGPGDCYDADRTKVMGGMVKRFVDAAENKQESVSCWGTGNAKREFLYVEDAAKLIHEAMLRYDDPTMPLNIGTGQEVSIKQLAHLVSLGVPYTGQITWDTTKPDGQMRKRLDLSRMKACLPATPLTPLEEGIKKTIEDYREQAGRCRQ